jgi:hypothetical protein
LRGWKEKREISLDSKHAVPFLARLVRTDDGVADGDVFAIHGPDLYVGRFHPQHGPVDMILTNLADHEVYKLGAPHARLTMDERSNWTVRSMTPSAHTCVNGERIMDTQTAMRIRHGDRLTLGVLEFIFEAADISFAAWKESQKEILLAVEEPSLFLVRSGAVCGPRLILNAERRTVVGRTFPAPGELPGDVWGLRKQPDWDLAGLRDHEKKFVGFRHCELWCEGEDDWSIQPISTRQRTFVNRVEISGVMPLMPGDEVAMGSVLFHFHHPSNIRASTDRRTVDLPSVVDWREAHARPAVKRRR